MAEPKTKKNRASVKAFIDSIDDEQKRRDSRVIMKLMKDATGNRPAMWGHNIVGYGSYHYTYASGREGDWFLTGFSPRKQNLTLYIMSGFDAYEPMLDRLGKHSTGKSCLYVKRLEDVDTSILRDLIEASVSHVEATNPG